MSTDTVTTKQEDHTTSIEAPQVEALAAAAAAAVTASATAEATQATVVPVITLAHTPVQTTNGRVSLLNDEDPQGKRRFFPRVKHLISNKEWEDVSSINNNSLQLGSVLFFLSLSLLTSIRFDSIIAQPIYNHRTFLSPSSLSHTHIHTISLSLIHNNK